MSAATLPRPTDTAGAAALHADKALVRYYLDRAHARQRHNDAYRDWNEGHLGPVPAFTYPTFAEKQTQAATQEADRRAFRNSGPGRFLTALEALETLPYPAHSVAFECRCAFNRSSSLLGSSAPAEIRFIRGRLEPLSAVFPEARAALEALIAVDGEIAAAPAQVEEAA